MFVKKCKKPGYEFPGRKTKLRSFCNQKQKTDSFLLKSRPIHNFPSRSHQVNFDTKTISIHQILLNYVTEVKSGARGSKNIKIIDIKEESQIFMVNIMEIYKFKIEKNVLDNLKQKFFISEQEKKTLRIFFDGGCAGHQRLGFFGCTFYLDNDNILKIAGNIGPENTNNTAEYTGLIMSLLILHLMNFDKNCINIKVYSDSELVCKQMKGEYKVTTPHIIVLNCIAKNLYKKILIKEKEISHIYRELNEEADYVGNHGKTLSNNSFLIYY